MSEPNTPVAACGEETVGHNDATREGKGLPRSPSAAEAAISREMDDRFDDDWGLGMKTGAFKGKHRRPRNHMGGSLNALLDIAGNKSNPLLSPTKGQLSSMATSEASALEHNAQDEMRTKEKVAKFAEHLENLFPRAVPEDVFIETVTKVVSAHGFTPETSINLVSVCRDEICRPFVDKLDKIWSNSFNISSLAGMIFCGRTGFKAAMAHAPVAHGKERYIFWVAPHIAVSLSGGIGKVWRTGRMKQSSACGALMAVQNEIMSGQVKYY